MKTTHMLALMLAAAPVLAAEVDFAHELQPIFAEHCIRCHGPATETQRARKWNQQGHMECLMCHEDHG